MFDFILSVNVAKRLPDDSFGMVFGINTLLALALQSILTYVVVSDNGFKLEAIESFTVYSAYFIILAAIYALAGIIQLFYPLPERPLPNTRDIDLPVVA